MILKTKRSINEKIFYITAFVMCIFIGFDIKKICLETNDILSNAKYSNVTKMLASNEYKKLMKTESRCLLRS